MDIAESFSDIIDDVRSVASYANDEYAKVIDELIIYYNDKFNIRITTKYCARPQPLLRPPKRC